MGFKTIKLKKRKRYTTKKTNSILANKVILYGILGFFLVVLSGIGFIYFKVIRPLPSISSLEAMDIKEASIIYDKNGGELYTLFGDEKRTYVNYNQISKNMVNAIIAGEDKRYWENPGIDIIGLLRAGFYGIIGKNEGFGGTSTLTQQLIRNTIIENRSSAESISDKLERKIKEFYLAYKLTNEASKEKILELYLNKIPFGSNAFGIEQASLTFFGKRAADLSILEGSMLASIPKGPTYYSPYNYFTRLVGNLYVYPKGDVNSTINLIKKSELEENKMLVEKFTSFISGLKATRLGENGILVCNLARENFKKSMSIDKDGCSIMNYSDLLGFLNNIILEDNGKQLEYQTGRKDFILGRMLEDNYINFDEYKESILAGIGFEFREYRENIKYPHFVMYVREYLAGKYGEELLEEGGLKIYTSLDSDLQMKAEELVQNQVKTNLQKFDANNAALISIDNASGDIIAYVGGADYFNKEIDGNVNMLNSKRQPGSSFKPFVYALAIDKNSFGPHTPIYDIPTVFPGNYEPKNYNGKFSGKMTLMTALNHSRNIPAIKLYFLAGEQKGIIDYLKSVGVQSLDENFYYGAPLALGTGEMTPLEVAQAYTVFANMGNKVEINPILKILDSKGLVIEEKKKSAGVRVLDAKTAYIMNYILSATYSRPDEFWNANLSLRDRQAGAKTGTSNKTYITNGKRELFPGDLWTAGYTPQITTVVWAGNTNGKAINRSGDGLNGAAPIWKQFMEYALKNQEKLTWKIPEGLKYTKISKISGLLAPEGFEPSLTVDSLFKNIPTDYDTSLQSIQYDAMCNGKVGANTPAAAIKTGYYIAYHSIDQTNAVWEEGVQKWAKENGYKEFSNFPNIISDYKDVECQRDQQLVSSSNIEVRTKIENGETFVNGYNYVEIGYKSNNPITKLQILLGENIIQEINIDNKSSGVYVGGITIPSGYSGEYNLTVRAIDVVYMGGEETKNINIILKDTTPPVINVTNPEKDAISLYSDQYFNLRGTVQDRSKIKTINIYLDGNAYNMGIEAREFAVEINKDFSLPIGQHTIKIEAVDLFFNKSEKTISLEIMQR
ncbi:MAG: transglycosylase domain-containing protein [Candidatus Altimarinota bacterium]